MSNSYRESVTSMLHDLEWPPLQHGRRIKRLTTFYKAVNNSVPVTIPDNIIPSIRQDTRLHSRTRLRSGHKWINLWPTSCFRRPSPRSIPSVILCHVAVSQGSVLGLVLFLIYKWTTRQLLYADDCVLYRNVCSLPDCLTLQEDLTDRTSLALDNGEPIGK